jgi:hypothetical protein
MSCRRCFQDRQFLRVTICGSARPCRESLLADAAVFLMKTWSEDASINIEISNSVTTADLAWMIPEAWPITESRTEPRASYSTSRD